MICQGCGHYCPSTTDRCIRCGHANQKQSGTSRDSRLLEFPRKTAAAPGAVSTNGQPSWKAELSEKVQEFKARKQAAAKQSGEVDDRSATYDSISKSGPGREESSSRTITPRAQAAIAKVRRAGQQSSPYTSSNPVASAAALQSALVIDRVATARALEPIEEPTPRKLPIERRFESELNNPEKKAASRITEKVVESAPPLPVRERPIERSEAPRPRISATVQASSVTVGAIQVQTNIPKTDIKTDFKEPRTVVPVVSADTYESLDIDCNTPIDEIEPIDYLEAEVRKVDEKLFHHESIDALPLSVRIISGVVDILTIALSAGCFLAVMTFSGADLSTTTNKAVAVVIATLTALFYLTLTQCLAGRTFGMMLTSTRVVQGDSGCAPSLGRSIVRSVGYFLALAPAAIGMFWMIFDYKGRGWHDILSGTTVVRDF